MDIVTAIIGGALIAIAALSLFYFDRQICGISGMIEGVLPPQEEDWPWRLSFLAGLIANKELRLDPVGKESTGYMPIDPYKRVLCMAFLTEQMDVGTVDYYHEGKLGGGAVKRARPVTRNIELENVERLRRIDFCTVVESPPELEANLQRRLDQLGLTWNASSS